MIDLNLYSEDQEDEDINANLMDWEVTSISSTKINLRLNFKVSKQVSSGWNRDQMSMEIDLSQFESSLNTKLPRAIVIREVPGQIASEAAYKVVQALESAEESAKE